MYILAAILLFVIGIAHSYLGERYILIRLFRRNDLPKIMGSEDFTKNTLRFAWHITTLAWFGFAAILFHMASDQLNGTVIGNVIGITFLFHFAIAVIASRGKHLSWPVFLTIGLVVLYASNS